MKMFDNPTRREFLRTGAVVSLTLAAGSPFARNAAYALDQDASDLDMQKGGCELVVQPILHLPQEQFGPLLLYSILPPAVLVYLVAEQYGQEPEKVAAMVGFGNIAAIAVVPLMLPFVLPQ